MNPVRRRSDVPRFVIHLPVVVGELAAAKRLAAALARSLTFMSEIDAGETTVSEEDHQGVRHRVFCDRVLPDGRRCARRNDHDGGCRP